MGVGTYRFSRIFNMLFVLLGVCVMISTIFVIRTNRKVYRYNILETEVQRQIVESYVYNKKPTKPVKGGDVFRIAVGGAVTSKGLKITQTDQVRVLPLFTHFLPSFCQCGSIGYEYHFYFGYDDNDVIADREFLVSVDERFNKTMVDRCGGLTIGGLHMVPCNYTGKPAWSQNDAMMQAYLDGMDFFYRLNDDTQPRTPRWTEAFIQTLAEFNPPYVGVVGPSCNEGHQGIMTHDFVHRTHIEIFGFYYPRVYSDWYADTWITNVYQPGRYAKLTDVRVEHREVAGRRYTVKHWGVDMEEGVQILAAKHSDIIKRLVKIIFKYIEYSYHANAIF